jgi:hypothetical protein
VGKATDACSGPLTFIHAEFKNKWSYTSTPLILLHGLDRYSYTFFLNLQTKFRNQTQFLQQCTLFILCYNRQARNLVMLSVTHHSSWLMRKGLKTSIG